MGVCKASTAGRPCFKYPAPTYQAWKARRPRPPLPPPPPSLPNFSDSPARRVSHSVETTTWSPEQPAPGAVKSPRAPPASDPTPRPPNPESHTHHQDVSTRAGSVSSRSSSSRQARLKRAEAREPSGAGGLSAGAERGARARQGESCAASSAPPCLSIAPRRPPPLGPEGRGCGTGWGSSGCAYSPPWGAIGSQSAGD